jgi:hypothetical protein
LTCTPKRTLELKPNCIILIIPKILPKVSSLKRAALTQKEHKIQPGLEIKDNNNTINIYD